MLFNGFSRRVDLFFGNGSGNIRCVDVEATDDQLMENVEIFSAVIVTNDTSVIPLFPVTLVVLDNNSKPFILHLRLSNYFRGLSR